MLKEGVVPYRAVRAPRGKIDFIRGLQPFFAAGEITLADDMPDLREQLLSFPTGRIDAPNALAYALLLKPGRLIYEGWHPNAHIETVSPVWGKPLYLAANATRSVVTAGLVQFADGRSAVLADWVVEGEAGEGLEGILREASLAAAGAKLTMIAGRQHWEQYGNVGLVQAARSLGVECRPGGDRAPARYRPGKRLPRAGQARRCRQDKQGC